MRVKVLMTCTLVLLLFLLGSGSTLLATGKDELVYVEGTDIDTLDPQRSTHAPTTTCLHLLYNGLVTWKDESLEIVPDLATSWDVSKDGLTWTFHLRKGVKFHDGSPFNAECVKFTFERLLAPETGSPYRAQFLIIDHIDVVDDYTVSITTKRPYPDFLLNIANGNLTMLSPTATKKWSVGEYGNHPVGTGPYKLKEIARGDRVVFVRNENYWGPKPKIRTIIYRPVPEASVRIAMLRTGEADIVAKIPPEELKKLSSDPTVKVIASPAMFQLGIELRCDQPPLNDIRVRQALNYAVDKKAIAENILLGAGEVATAPYGPGIDFRANLKPYPYDPEKAKLLLKEAGYPNGFKLKLWAPNGRYLKDKQIAEAIQGYLQNIGIDVELRIMDWPEYTQMQRSPERQALMLGRATPGADYTMTRLWSRDSWNRDNLTLYWNPKLEELLAEARVCFDRAKREKLYHEAQSIVWNEAPFIFLHSQYNTFALKPDIQGFVVIPQEVCFLARVEKK